MKARTVKRELLKKFNDFLASIEDDELRKMVKKNSIITGGSIASMLVNEPVNDFDVYFTDHNTAAAVAKHYVKRFVEESDEARFSRAQVVIGQGEGKSYRERFEDDRVWIYLPSSGVAGTPQPGFAGETLGEELEPDEVEEDDSLPPYRPVFLSQNAITLSDKIQLIIRFFGKPDEIHENYDFAHCTNYWVSKGNELVLRPEAIESLLVKDLQYIGSKYPVCSIIRTRKFIRRGFSVTAGQYLKMILQCNELDLFDIDVLEDQLVGVDSAYFMEVIELVRADNPEKLNAAYLCELIDRIF